MKTIYTTLLLFISLTAFGQNFPTSSLNNTIVDSNGDPQTNIIDQDGAKQGEWFFKNVWGEEVFKQEFINNNISFTAFKFENQWISLASYQQNNIETSTLRSEIINLLDPSIFNGERLITIVQKGNSSYIHLFGTWENPMEVFVQIENLLTNYSLSNHSYVFIQ